MKPLEVSSGCKRPEQKCRRILPVLRVGQISHCFYGKKMEGYFGQFGIIKKIKLREMKRPEIKTFWVHRFQISRGSKYFSRYHAQLFVFEHLQANVITPELSIKKLLFPE